MYCCCCVCYWYCASTAIYLLTFCEACIILIASSAFLVVLVSNKARKKVLNIKLSAHIALEEFSSLSNRMVYGLLPLSTTSIMRFAISLMCLQLDVCNMNVSRGMSSIHHCCDKYSRQRRGLSFRLKIVRKFNY